jgi:hypothetical protein
MRLIVAYWSLGVNGLINRAKKIILVCAFRKGNKKGPTKLFRMFFRAANHVTLDTIGVGPSSKAGV